MESALKHLHAAASIGLPPHGVFGEDGPPWMESAEKLGYLRWNPCCSYLHTVFSIGLPPDEVYRKDRPPWMESNVPRMESRLKPITATMNGMAISGRYCHSSFDNDLQPFNDIFYNGIFL
jgi:hypothetical protein